jgi:hypothetical protein
VVAAVPLPTTRRHSAVSEIVDLPLTTEFREPPGNRKSGLKSLWMRRRVPPKSGREQLEGRRGKASEFISPT